MEALFSSMVWREEVRHDRAGKMALVLGSD
jgi:hypothetical protein